MGAANGDGMALCSAVPPPPASILGLLGVPRGTGLLDLTLFQNLLHGVGQGEVPLAALRQAAAAPGPGRVAPMGPGTQLPQTPGSRVQTVGRGLRRAKRVGAFSLRELLGTCPQEAQVPPQDPGSAARVASQPEAGPVLAQLGLHLSIGKAILQGHEESLEGAQWQLKVEAYQS